MIPRKSPKTPLSLDSWPALPLSIWYPDDGNSMQEEQKADVVAAFKHSHRIREIDLLITMDYSFLTSIRNKSFPELEHLALIGPPSITLPPEFLGRSTPLPRLRHILLIGLHIPALSKLLLASRGLVSLHLDSHNLTRTGFISPEDLSTALSSTTQLEYLHFTCPRLPIGFYSELTSINASTLVLPALTFFYFSGLIEYLEKLVFQIHPPHLMEFIVSFNQNIHYVPQLSRFISRTEQLSSLPFQTSISLGFGTIEIEHHFRRLSSPQEVSRTHFKNFYMEDWQDSRVGHICAQLSPLASSVKQLKLSVFNLYLARQARDTADPAPWLQLLTLYDSVEEIELECFGRGEPCIGFARALQQSTWESAQELLPALRVLRIRGFDSRPIRLTMLFAAARQLTGRPVIAHCLDQD